MDNLRVHHTLDVKDLCKEYGIPLIFNLAYSPEYNPIETYFSLLKNLFKRAKLNCIANDIKLDVEDIIYNCTDKVK